MSVKSIRDKYPGWSAWRVTQTDRGEGEEEEEKKNVADRSETREGGQEEKRQRAEEHTSAKEGNADHEWSLELDRHTHIAHASHKKRTAKNMCDRIGML